MRSNFGSLRPRSELLAFAEFVVSAILIAVILHQLARLIVPDTLFSEHQRSFGLLAFLIAASGCASAFEKFSHHRPHHR